MYEVIASKYVNALIKDKDINTIQKYVDTLSHAVAAFSEQKFRDIVDYPFIEKSKKLDFIKEMCGACDKEVESFLSLLAQKDRLEIIPEVVKLLKRTLCEKKNEFRGVVISKEPIDDMLIDKLQKAFSAKVGSNILLSSDVADYEGVKIVVEDLGYEIAFSKSRLKENLVNHILKAI